MNKQLVLAVILCGNDYSNYNNDSIYKAQNLVEWDHSKHTFFTIYKTNWLHLHEQPPPPPSTHTQTNFHTKLHKFATLLKPVLNWANVCSPEHTSDTSTNYDSFLNWTFSSPNMVRTVQTLLHSQLACNDMQASAQTCGRHAADSLIENVG